MPTNVIMPALELAQETGKVLRWLKAPGDPVQKGEPMVEIETDKITIEIEAPASGILRDVTAQEGEVVPVGQTIALIAAAGEAAAAARLRRRAARPPRRRPRRVTPPPDRARRRDQGLAPGPEARRAARRRPRPGQGVRRHDPEGRRPRLRREPEGGAGGRNGARRSARLVAASPKARRLAAERGLDIGALPARAPAAPCWPRTLPRRRAVARSPRRAARWAPRRARGAMASATSGASWPSA